VLASNGPPDTGEAFLVHQIHDERTEEAHKVITVSLESGATSSARDGTTEGKRIERDSLVDSCDDVVSNLVMGVAGVERHSLTQRETWGGKGRMGRFKNWSSCQWWKD